MGSNSDRGIGEHSGAERARRSWRIGVVRCVIRRQAHSLRVSMLCYSQ